MTRKLEDRWYSIWSELGLSEPAPSELRELLRCYEESHRAYHTTQHLHECFAWFDRASDLAENPALVQLAIWFHDAVYDTHRAENEQQSADWAVHVVKQAGGSIAFQESIRSMILATKHGPPCNTTDERLVVDIDLSILGAPEARFDEYERQIRIEYAWVPEDLFRKTRSQILRRFLDRAQIYALSFFEKQLESQARTNLQKSLDKLSA